MRTSTRWLTLLFIFISAVSWPRTAAATFSIVARDPKTGALGVAVQSHWFSVGAVVSWAEPGVGAVATQATVDPSYGAKGLELLRQGKTARQALDTLLAADAEREMRQVSIVDAQGTVATHTGKETIPFAGQKGGPEFSVQANMMANDRVVPAMARAYEAATGPFAERLLAALDAAQAAGGDVRGKQSAALLVVDGQRSAEPWKHVQVNLRVDDAKEPLVELRRLLKLSRAYDLANDGDTLTAKKDFVGAARAYQDAARLAPESDELAFWAALSQAAAGQVDDAAATLKRLFTVNAGWQALLPYLRPHHSPGVGPLQTRLKLPPKSP